MGTPDFIPPTIGRQSYRVSLREAERLCPEALVLNYTNPMNMMCLAAGRTSSMQVVGLCHSVQGTGHLPAKRAGVPYDEMEWECAGINHLAWFTRLRHCGADLYPLLKRKAKADLAGRSSDSGDAADLVRKDMMVHFGAFIAESSGHLSEHLPYYRKRSDLVEKFCRPGYDGESTFYANNWPRWRADADVARRRMLAGRESIDFPRSWEYASWIIEAREKESPVRIHGNVMNRAAAAGPLIANLPATDGRRFRLEHALLRPGRHRCCRTQHRSRHPLAPARSADLRRVLTRRNQEDDPRALRCGKGLPSGLSLKPRSAVACRAQSATDESSNILRGW